MQQPTNEYLRIKNLCELYDCDRGTMEKLLAKARQTHDIPELVWNGQRRVHLPAFRRFLLENATLNF